MKVDVLLGLQWGDEGKGKVVDVLTPKYDMITRFQGGPNAGHTLEFNGEKYVLRSIPSGIFQGGKMNVIGNGVVLDPLLFRQEAEALAASGHDLTKQLYISKKAHLILPTHRILDTGFWMRLTKRRRAPGKLARREKVLARPIRTRLVATAYAWATFCTTLTGNMRLPKRVMKRFFIHCIMTTM